MTNEHNNQADHTALLRILARRARCFPTFPLGYHIPEVFAAIGEKPPAPDPTCKESLKVAPAPAVPRGERSEAAIDAGFAALEARGFRATGSYIGRDNIWAVFTAMLAASPAQPATEQACQTKGDCKRYGCNGACSSATEHPDSPVYTWESRDGKQHDTGRVMRGGKSFFADTASPQDARLIAEALNAYVAAKPDAQSVVWIATRLWNARELWTCPADIERMLAATPAAPSQPAAPQGEPVAFAWRAKKGQPSAWQVCFDLKQADDAEVLAKTEIRFMSWTTPAAPSQEPAVPQGWTDADSDAARLALELECLLLDTETLSVVSKWWASANEALELHRQRLATLAAPSQEPVTLTDDVAENAARYVWLRDFHIGDNPEFINLEPHIGGLDGAIDALREKESGK